MTETKPKKLTLDVEKWRCGVNGKNKLGEGETLLINDKGFMCCLGQFALQLGEPKVDIEGWGTPVKAAKDAEKLIPFLTEENEGEFINSDFSTKAMVINDGYKTTPQEKIKLLTDLCAENGIQLEVINKELLK